MTLFILFLYCNGSIQRERDYYSTNLSILNISSYSNWNQFWDAKILRTWEIMTLFKLDISQFWLFSEVRSADPPFNFARNSKNRGPYIDSPYIILQVNINPTPNKYYLWWVGWLLHLCMCIVYTVWIYIREVNIDRRSQMLVRDSLFIF